MDGVSSLKRVALPIAPAGASGLAAVAAMAVFVAPTPLLEAFAVDSGIAAIVSAAEPPLGMTARLVLTFAAAATVYAIAWLVLDLLGPGRTLTMTGEGTLPKDVRAPAGLRLPGLAGLFRFGLPRLSIRGAAADAAAVREPAREPVRAARDLGVPFLEVSATRAPARIPDIERSIPKDLDLPLAHYDPAAVPSVPAAPVPLVPALARIKADEVEATPEPEPETLVLSQLAPEPRPLAIVPPVLIAEPEPLPESAGRWPRPAERSPEPAERWPQPAERWPQPAERWDVVALPTPPVTRACEKSDRPTEATIQALLDRLERGVAHKTPAAPEPLRPTIRDTLGELRALASR